MRAPGARKTYLDRLRAGDVDRNTFPSTAFVGKETYELAPAQKNPKTPEEMKTFFGKPIGGLFQLKTGLDDFDSSLNPENSLRKIGYDFSIAWKTPEAALKEQYAAEKKSANIIKSDSYRQWRDGYDKFKLDQMIKASKNPNFKGFPIVVVQRNRNGSIYPFQEGHHRLMVAKGKVKSVPILEATDRKNVPVEMERWWSPERGFFLRGQPPNRNSAQEKSK